MAASNRIGIFEPRRVLLGVNLLMLVLFLAAVSGMMQLYESEHERLLTEQLDTLIKARSTDLETLKYRKFVEGVSQIYQEAYISVEDKQGVFASASQKPLSSMCAEANYHNIRILFCKEFPVPKSALILLMSSFLILSISSWVALRIIEKKGSSSLIKLFEDSGVHIDPDQGLYGILNKMSEFQIDLEKTRQRELDATKRASVADFAAQVAHDIRSPLTTLEVLNAKSQEGDAESKKVMQMAIERIQDIANGLLNRYRESSKTTASEDEIRPHSVNSLISPIVEEKQIQLGQQDKRINLLVEGLPSVGTELIRSNRIQFHRVLSNILNNAFESISEEGDVSVIITKSRSDVKIKVQDTGRGIPKSKLKLITQRGYSFGKNRGTGLGLFHAQTCVESWKGSIVLESTFGSGTAVTLSFPQVNG